MGAKIFNVEQLRLGDRILKGNPAGEIFYGNSQLATGTSAVPMDRTLTAGAGLKFQVGATTEDTVDLTTNRHFFLNVDDTSVYVDLDDKLTIKNQGVESKHLKANVAGDGLIGANGDPLAVGIDPAGGLQASADAIGIKNGGVVNVMIADNTIENIKLKTISATDKVQGTAVQLDGTSLRRADGLRINDQGVLPIHLSSNVAGNGLIGGNGDALAVGVEVGGALETTADAVRVREFGITNIMLAGGITDDRLVDIRTANKVRGSAVELATDGGLENHNPAGEADDGLRIETHGVGKRELDAIEVAGDGLIGDIDGALHAHLGAGLDFDTEIEKRIKIATAGIVDSMISIAVNGNTVNGIASNKLQGDIPMSKTRLAAGLGLTLNTDTLNVGQGDGIVVEADSIKVDSTVVRTNANQTLNGSYTFTAQNITFDHDVFVGGNLTVQGGSTVVLSNEVNIGDAIILLNSDFSGSNPTEDAGIQIDRDLNGDVRVIFDEDTDLWKLGKVGEEAEILTFPRTVVDLSGANTVFRGVFSSSKAVKVGATRVYFAFEDLIAHTPVIVGGVHIPVKFHSTPIVVVSLQNRSTEFYDHKTLVGGVLVDIDQSTDGRSDLVGCMVSQVNEFGFTVDFTTAIPGSSDQEAQIPAPDSSYFLNAYICSVDVSV